MRFFIALLFLFSAVSPAATLGELKVRSALGERFDAAITLTLSEGENLDEACFQLQAARTESDVRTLRLARLGLSQNQLRIRGSEIENEPILRLVIRVACPNVAVRAYEREYITLLDPRISSVPESLESEPLTRPASAIDVSLKRVPQSTSTALAARTPIPPTIIPKVRQTQSRSRDGGLHLRIASVLPDVRQTAPLNEKDALQLRERLLLIEADDQAAQLLQLKDRIARLEKQLTLMSSLAGGTAGPAPDLASQASPVSTRMAVIKSYRQASDPQLIGIAHNEPDGRRTLFWTALVLFVILACGWVLRWMHLRRQSELQQVFMESQVFPDSTPAPRFSEAMARPVVAHKVEPMTDSESSAWQEMDVVQPGNVQEEIQLLLDHGLGPQALRLLQHEITHRPTTLALWMRLFDACAQLGERRLFADYASRFRTQFASESLWHEVQSLGRELDPDNPLYAVNAQPGLVEGRLGEPKGNDDFDIVSYMASSTAAGDTVEGDLGLPELEFSLDHALNEASSPSEHYVFSADDFLSDDPDLQRIATLLAENEHTAAYQQLEALLYGGSLEQRIVASRWLDKLMPVQNKLG